MDPVQKHLREAISTEDFFWRLAADYTVVFDGSRSCVGAGDMLPIGCEFNEDGKRLIKKANKVQQAILQYANLYPNDQWLEAYAWAYKAYDGRVSDDKTRRALRSIVQIKRQKGGLL